MITIIIVEFAVYIIILSLLWFVVDAYTIADYKVCIIMRGWMKEAATERNTHVQVPVQTRTGC